MISVQSSSHQKFYQTVEYVSYFQIEWWHAKTDTVENISSSDVLSTDLMHLCMIGVQTDNFQSVYTKEVT